MQKLLLSVAAAAALAAALPAVAQPWSGQRDYGQSYRDQGQTYGAQGQGYRDQGQTYRGQGQSYRGGADRRLTTAYVDSLDWRIVNAAREGRIGRGEANQMRSEVRAVHDMVWRVETGQARAWEVNRVQQVVSRVERLVGVGERYAGRRTY